MANQRREGQKLIGCQADETLIAQIDAARGRKGRSFFLREALAEKLRQMGYEVSDDLVYAPDPIRSAIVADQGGSYNTMNIHQSTSRSGLPRSAVQRATAGKKNAAKKKAKTK